MKKVLIKADTRGHEFHGWLDAKHTFSFANYYDPSRIHFGVLRVLNDDIVEPSEGFGTHPHDNMEIVTIPLEGTLTHRDSMGHTETLSTGEVQVMSAGTGILHSEFNASAEERLNIFQIWVIPDKQEVEPRYKQMRLDQLAEKNVIHTFVTPYPNDDGLWIHQNAWFSMGTLDKGVKKNYAIKAPKNGVFAMVIEGSFRVGDTVLERRDGIGIYDTGSIEIEALDDNARILLIDVPMEF